MGEKTEGKATSPEVIIVVQEREEDILSEGRARNEFEKYNEVKSGSDVWR